MPNRATIVPVLYRSKTYSNGAHPVYIRITKDRKPRYRSLEGATSKPKHWKFQKTANGKKKDMGKPLPSHPDFDHVDKLIRATVNKYEEAQKALIEEGRAITADRIIQRAENSIEKLSVLDFYERIISELRSTGKVSNAEHYEDVRKQFENFLEEKGRTGILFPDIDHNLLKEWETRLRKRGVKETTLFAYFKNLRALYRAAIKRGAANEQDYPFKDFKVSKFNTQAEKRAISTEDVRAIESLDLSREFRSVQEARKYALFSYYAFGMNLTDMAYLRWGDIREGFIQYQRKKTGKFLKIPLLDPAKEIIEYFRPVTEGRAYVFPILDAESHQTETQRFNRIHKVRTRTNKALKRIAELAGIKENVTLYTFRHTSATRLYRQGVPASVIQQFLSHETEKQTRTYLQELEGSELVQYAQKLVSDE